MKKSMTLCISGLMALCFSMSISAQSSQQELDQVELMKQFIGSWTAERGVDSTVVWEIIPLGKGYEQNLFWKSKGETYWTDKGVIGVTSKGGVELIFLWSGKGSVSRDYGKFESKKRIILERFNIEHTHVNSTFDYHFMAPDKLKMIWKRKGDEDSGDNAEVTEWIWAKLKK